MMTALQLVTLIRDLAVVLFVALGGLTVCVAVDAGAAHRALVDVVARWRGYVAEEVAQTGVDLDAALGRAHAVAIAWVVQVECWWHAEVRRALTWRPAVAVATLALSPRQHWNQPTGEHRLASRLSSGKTLSATALIIQLRKEREHASQDLDA